MDTSPESNISMSTILAFGIGMLTGSIIGLTGVMILTAAGFGYYNREVIIDIVKDLSQRYNVDPLDPPPTENLMGYDSRPSRQSIHTIYNHKF